VKTRRNDRFADHVYGVDGTIQAKIEVLDDFWEAFWTGAKKFLLVAVAVFLCTAICLWMGWQKDLVRVYFPISIIACAVGYLAVFYTYFCVKQEIGIMLGTGVAKVIERKARPYQ
jgi:hypothetical protein